ncbi:MAG: SCP2 sterol-binding domain-containing protein [Propionivibrio sp.]
MLPLFATPLLRFVNHLLTGEEWARARLKAFSGQLVRFELGDFGLLLEISPAGFFRASDKDVPPGVTVSLPADAPLRLLNDRASLLAAAQISGSTELAEALSFVLRNLRWDAEGDLAQVVGDVAARRLSIGGRQFLQWQRDQAKNLAQNFAEYFTEEATMIARQPDVAAFCREVTEAAEALAHLEKRVALLDR